MANISIQGGDKLNRVLKTMAAAAGKAHSVSVGYQDGSTFVDGTSVAMVAAIQNYGAPGASIPARPFFSGMVKRESPDWHNKLGKILKASEWDGEIALARMGDMIGEDLKESVRSTNSPPLSPVTIMLRSMRSQGGPDFVVTGATVGEAARKVAAGDPTPGAATKPLIDTPEAHLVNSVTYEVAG